MINDNSCIHSNEGLHISLRVDYEIAKKNNNQKIINPRNVKNITTGSISIQLGTKSILKQSFSNYCSYPLNKWRLSLDKEFLEFKTEIDFDQAWPC